MRTISKHAAAAAAFAGLTAPIAPLVMAADASGEDTGTLSAIIVTAERRAESIQSVPLSVTAITGDTLTKFDIVSFDDYAHLVPNLSFGTGNTFGITNGREITIRGISGFNTTSYYINDTPLPISIDPRAVDLQRIEVLRGPQGTLFGSSAMGGTVRLITRQPDLSKSFGSADAQTYVIHEGGVGYMVTANYNLPLIDNQMAVLMSGYSTYNPGVFTGQYGIPTVATGLGYDGNPWPRPTVPASQPRQTVDHLGNDVEAGATLSLTYRPEALDALTITPMIMYQDQSNNGFPLADYTTQNLTQVRPLNNRESDTDIWQFGNLTIKYAAPFGSFINSSTYFHRYSRDTEDGSELISIGGYGGPPIGGTCTTVNVYCPSPSPNWVKSNQFTEELRFESSFPGPFQVIARRLLQQTAAIHRIRRGTALRRLRQSRLHREYSSRQRGIRRVRRAVPTPSSTRSRYRPAYGNRIWSISNDLHCQWLDQRGAAPNSPVASSQDATTPRFTAKYKFDCIEHDLRQRGQGLSPRRREYSISRRMRSTVVDRNDAVWQRLAVELRGRQQEHVARRTHEQPLGSL